MAIQEFTEVQRAALVKLPFTRTLLDPNLLRHLPEWAADLDYHRRRLMTGLPIDPDDDIERDKFLTPFRDGLIRAGVFRELYDKDKIKKIEEREGPEKAEEVKRNVGELGQVLNGVVGNILLAGYELRDKSLATSLTGHFYAHLELLGLLSHKFKRPEQVSGSVNDPVLNLLKEGIKYRETLAALGPARRLVSAAQRLFTAAGKK